MSHYNKPSLSKKTQEAQTMEALNQLKPGSSVAEILAWVKKTSKSKDNTMKIIRTTIPNPNWHSVSVKDAMRTFYNFLDMSHIEATILLKNGETIKVGEGRYKLA